MSAKRVLPWLAASALLASAASAAPVQWAVNGHWYEAVSVPGGISWTQANAAAQAAGGYLATATSSSENAFIFSLVDSAFFWNQEPGGSNLGPWLGGYQTSDDGSTPAANWAWVTGESWVFTVWHSGEPNNWTGADENYLSYKCYGPTGCRIARWNDLPDAISELGTAVVGYVIEYNSLASVLDPAGSSAELRSGVPNPFVERTTIRFRMAQPGPASLGVHDVAGRTVRTLVSGELPAGGHEAVWDGRDERGVRVAAGTYFVRLETAGRMHTVRTVRVR